MNLCYLLTTSMYCDWMPADLISNVTVQNPTSSDLTILKFLTFIRKVCGEGDQIWLFEHNKHLTLAHCISIVASGQFISFHLLHFLPIHRYYRVSCQRNIFTPPEENACQKGVSEHCRFQELGHFGPKMLYLRLYCNCTCLPHSETSKTHSRFFLLFPSEYFF